MKATLLTEEGFEVSCLILSRKPLFYGGEEVIAYCQHQLIKGYFNNDYVVKISVLAHFVIAPELEESLKES